MEGYEIVNIKFEMIQFFLFFSKEKTDSFFKFPRIPLFRKKRSLTINYLFIQMEGYNKKSSTLTLKNDLFLKKRKIRHFSKFRGYTKCHSPFEKKKTDGYFLFFNAKKKKVTLISKINQFSLLFSKKTNNKEN